MEKFQREFKYTIKLFLDYFQKMKVDYDWRFRYPLVLPLVMIFSISVEAFLRNNSVK
jgi:hypothetical protein